MLFLACSWRFLISKKLEQLEFKQEKIIGIQKHVGKVRKSKFMLDLNQERNLREIVIYRSFRKCKHSRDHQSSPTYIHSETNNKNLKDKIMIQFCILSLVHLVSLCHIVIQIYNRNLGLFNQLYPSTEISTAQLYNWYKNVSTNSKYL